MTIGNLVLLEAVTVFFAQDLLKQSIGYFKKIGSIGGSLVLAAVLSFSIFCEKHEIIYPVSEERSRQKKN